MTHDQMIGAALVSLIGSIVLTIALTRWRNRKGRTSEFAADTSLEDVGLSALSSLGSGSVKMQVDGRTELRPPFGLRVIAPAVALAVLFGLDLDPLLDSLNLSDPRIQNWIGYGLLALIAFTAFQLNFRQRVIYDRDVIECRGVDPVPQTRKLDDLVAIAVHPKRSALVLTFAGQRTLYIPKFLTGRDRFVAEMKRIAAANRARGLEVPRQGLAARMGF